MEINPSMSDPHIPPLHHAMLTHDLSPPDNTSAFDFPEFNVDDLEFFDDLLFDPLPELDSPSPCHGSTELQLDNSGFHPASDFGIPSDHSNGGDQVSSQGSGELNSRVLSNFSSFSDNSTSKTESRIEIEEVRSRKSNPKRKKGQDDKARTIKFIRSSEEDSCIDLDADAGEEGDHKKKARLMRNRESAQVSRQRKKKHVDELEDKVKSMHSTIAELNRKFSYIVAENAALRQQMIGGMVPPNGMYPTAPMGYPWMMHCPSYVVRSQGSQVPLVPIPRLRPQRLASAPKVRKKSEEKKNVGVKTKKVASVSFLGLLFFVLLFGGLVPVVNVKYGDGLSISDEISEIRKGRVLMVDGHLKDADSGSGRDGSVSNSSEPLAASLYVPRNDKLVKIDGNLIIHSVLASERGGASPQKVEMKTREETHLAIARSYASSYRVAGDGQSNSRGSQVDDGRMPQWFSEDLSGSMLSSGMCTEVFQFDVSPTPGSIVPATSIRNATSRHSNHSTNLKKSRNRRILSEHPIPLNVHALNFTEEHPRPTKERGSLQGNKSSSSIVVSVLVDPREAGEGDVDDVMRSKSLSRILVVVLIDSVKYVTYSCMLPLMGSSPHLVNT